MAARDLKVYLKTFSDATGITKLGQHIKEHSIVVRGLGRTYQATASVAKASLSLIGAELRFVRNAAIGAAAAMTGIAIKGVSAFMESDDAAKSLSASLSSLGYNADELMPKFTALASELQMLTRVGDDETLSLASTLLNFGVAPEKIDGAIRGTIGLATAMRMDLGSAAQNLALAYEGQFTMLSRYIPALRTATTDAEKMAIVQGVMARGFEQAQAAAGTLAGRWDQLKNRVGDLWEKIGQTVAESLNLSGAFEKAERAVNSLIDSAVFDKIATGLRSAVSYVIVQVKTAADLIEYLRSQDFGMARIAEVGKTVVVELITMAVTLLMALIKANLSVFIGLVKMVAAAFKKEILDVVKLVPGMSSKVGAMAEQKLSSLDKEQADELAKSLGFKSGNEMVQSWAYQDGDLDSSIAAFEGSAGVVKAMSETAGKLKDTLADVDAQWTKSKDNIKASAGQASGGDFNWDQRAAANRAEIDSFMTPPPPTGPSPYELRLESARKRRELEKLQLQATAAKMDQDLAAMQTPEEQRLSQWQQTHGQRNYAPNSFAGREVQQLSEAAKASRAAADKAAAEATAAMAGMAAMMSQLATRLKDVESQLRNAP